MTAPDPETALVTALTDVILGDLILRPGRPAHRARRIALAAVRTVTEAGWTPPPTTDPDRCRYCGRTSHGMACRGLLEHGGGGVLR